MARRRHRLSRPPEVVKDIATYQRGVILCILAEVIFGITFAGIREAAVLPEMVLLIGGIAAYVIIAVIALVLIFQLASRVYSSTAAGLLAVVVLIPCLGLLALLVINVQATTILQANGVRVGFLGARMSDVRRLLERGEEDDEDDEEDEDDYEDDDRDGRDDDREERPRRPRKPWER
jgi:hypothetical protein